MDDTSAPMPSDTEHYRPTNGGKFYINKEEDFTVSDISQGMTTAIGIAVDDQVYGLGEVRVIGLDNLLSTRESESTGRNRNGHADEDIIDPDEECDVVLQLHDMKPSPNLSRNTSLSSLTNEFYKVRDSNGKAFLSERWNHSTSKTNDDDLSFDEKYTYSHNEFHKMHDSSHEVAISERWHHLTTRKNDDELSFDNKYTGSHPPSDASSFPKENVDMGWPSLSSTRTPIEGNFQAAFAVPSEAQNFGYLTSMGHLNDLTLAPSRLDDARSHNQNTFSDKSTSRSIAFPAYVYHRVTHYSRKKKAYIALSTALFLVLVTVAFVMGFGGSNLGQTKTSNFIPSYETSEVQEPTKRENSSSESKPHTDVDVLLASVLSDHNDAEHEKTLPSQTAVATRPEAESKTDEEQVNQIFNDLPGKNYESFLLPTTSPVASDNFGGLFDLNADPSSSPVLFVSPAHFLTLQSTVNHLTHSSESPPKKGTTNATKMPSPEPNLPPTPSPSARPTPVPIERIPFPTRHPRKRQSLKPQNQNPATTNPQPNNPESSNPEPSNTEPNRPRPNNPKPVNSKPDEPEPDLSPSLPSSGPVPHPSYSTNEPTQVWWSVPPSAQQSVSPSLLLYLKEPTSFPQAFPSPEPSKQPMFEPSESTQNLTTQPSLPIALRTPEPTPLPTLKRTPEPTPLPSPDPTPSPTPEPTPEPTPKPISCSERQFSYNSAQNECTNAITTGEYDGLEDCCDEHFGSYESCKFEDICGNYVPWTTPVPTMNLVPPTPRPTMMETTEPPEP